MRKMQTKFPQVRCKGQNIHGILTLLSLCRKKGKRPEALSTQDGNGGNVVRWVDWESRSALLEASTTG
jgi:hypothetical protein